MKNSAEKKRVVVVGNGMVGHRFCEKLIEYDKAGAYHITVFGAEKHMAYDRVHLSSLFDGATPEDLRMAESDTWYHDHGITVHLGEEVVGIGRDTKTIVTAMGREVFYDILILSTGSSAFIPPMAGVENEGVFPYRTIEDVADIKTYGAKAKHIAVIGGGLLGLEAAKACKDMGVKTTVVERAPFLMARQVDPVGGKVLADLIVKLGVDIRTDKITKRILGEADVQGIEFDDGSVLDVDMVVVSAGIRPNDLQARACGLTVGERGGVVVDNRLTTSDASIFAIGEVALFKGMIYGLVGPGFEMADVVASNLCGLQREFNGADMSTKLKLMGVDVASLGDPFSGSDKTHTVTVHDSRRGVYKKLVMCNEGKSLLGAILVGDAAEYGQLSYMIKNGKELPEIPEALLVKGGGADTGFGIENLTDEDIVCSCNAVTKGAICKAIAEHGLTSLDDVKRVTKAGTGCGGCMPMVNDLFKLEMIKAGVTVTNHLCEHFPYSREELYQIIKVTGAKTFDEILTSHGKGCGCEICKPAVASILASLWNDYVAKHAQIQDTNDKYMGNIQRNGTYSVVPRAPGGELTPQQLIRIGEVAIKYDLYSKLTGGQRIALFGAHLSQLPSIWKDLVEVGLETGHAYGKSLRTVKSCVGSTWCRFGVQDSVDMAVVLENRYKGLRSPHKIKMAVSGCKRECAEAMGKDVGLIATEVGKNLYVCGNGGITPRHADLLASDVDSETCIKYIDRFLMYYVKTADKLTRTSTWLGHLDGGLNHLKAVVIDDKLKINEELETQMQYIVDTYQCEWATTLQSPEKLAMFTHFANSPEKDSVKHIRVRDQKRPAPWDKEYPQQADDASYFGGDRLWVDFGPKSVVPSNGGATMKYGRHQIAVFHFEKKNQWFASQNMCPHKREMVLSRGLLGDVKGIPKVVCPMHKRSFSLETGEGLADPEYRIHTFPVEIRNDRIFIQLPSEDELDKLHICDSAKQDVSCS
ncbi:MAG: nitrite reductase small subunit NirD [Kiritimatiellaceae bacterium]|nr:nitrite reductase small subunit NirD [Kiritimatiellaceae bacterium]